MSQKTPKKTALLTKKQEATQALIAHLKHLYPDAHCALDFETPFQLLIATILSAQCTDARVNLVTKVLFKKYPDAVAMSKATLPDLESIIKSTGFFRAKARSLLETSIRLVEKYGGTVPADLEILKNLRGVGRKTANVVLGNAYGIPGMVVDTHVGRLSRRLGLTRATDPVKVEFALMKLVPKEDWVMFSHWLISHGRAVCDARKPKCQECPLAESCPKNGVPKKFLIEE